MNKTDKNIELYNVLRVIAVILVLASHATYFDIVYQYGGVKYNMSNPSSCVEITSQISKFIYIFHMPLFVSISGALFYKTLKDKKIKNFELIKSKFNKLIIPYLGYGILYNIFIKFISNYYSLENLPYAVIMETLFGKNTVQYIWFLKKRCLNLI